MNNVPQTVQQKLEFIDAAPAQLKTINGFIKETETVVHESLERLGEAVKLLNEHLTAKKKVIAEISKISSDMIGEYEHELELVKEFKRSNLFDYEIRMMIASRAESSIYREIDKWKFREDIALKGYGEIVKKSAAVRATLRENLDAFADSIPLQ